MTVTFYTFSKRVNSTAQPTSGTDYSCIIKEGCSVMRPSIRLKYAGTNPTAYNYAYLADFGRYYWIRDWFFVDRQWEAELEVDVLASYKSQIGSSSQYVVRSASSFNNDIVDGLYPTLFEPWVQSTHAGIWSISDQNTISNQTYVISTMGKSGLQQYYLCNGDTMQTVANEIFSASIWSSSLFDAVTEDILKAAAQPENALASVQWLPLTWSQVSADGDAATTIEFSFYDLTGLTNLRTITPQHVRTLFSDIAIPTHPQLSTRGGFLSGNTFTKMELFIPGLGTIAIDADKCVTCNQIEIEYRVNLATGAATFRLIAQKKEADNTISRSNVLGVYESKVSVDMGYGTTRFDMGGIAQGVLSGIGAAMTGNFIGATSGLITAAAAAVPQTTILNTSGSRGAYQSNAELLCRFYRLVDEDLADRGRPLCKVKQISTLSGYVQCADATLALACTSQELNEILGFMNGGFFYE